MKWLKELKELIDKNFPIDWIDELINNDDNLDNFKLSLKERKDGRMEGK